MKDMETILSAAASHTGSQVELSQMLNARERRVFLQRELLSAFGKPLISYTLNIPGPVKVLPLTPEAFVRGISGIEEKLEMLGLSVLHSQALAESTGLEAFWVVDAEVPELKSAMVDIEDGSALGRLFDIDVIGTDGMKASRGDLGLPVRTCLLCGQPAHACARSRSHTVAELTKKIEGILRKEFTQQWHSTES